MKFKPLSDKILVATPQQKAMTDGGLHIPQQALDANKPQSGFVMAVGPGRITEAGDLVPMTVEPGLTVLFGAYAGVEQEIQGQKCLILRQDDVLLVEDKEIADGTTSNDVLDGATVG